MMSIHGVGSGIADMTASLLIRCRGVHFPDEAYIDVKPDVHIRRVLYRLGVSQSETAEADAIRAAARLNPDSPVALDPALWIIGRRWCSPTKPRCSECVASDICRYPKPGPPELI